MRLSPLVDGGRSARKTLARMAAGLLFGLFIAVGLIYGRIAPDAYETSFWNRRPHIVDKMRAQKSPDRREDIDVVTLHGWRGRLAHDGKAGTVTMDLRDMHGDPVRRLRLRARIADGVGRVRARRIMRQGADGLYRAGNLDLPKGRFDLTVTGRDPRRPGSFELIFRIEKQITVE